MPKRATVPRLGHSRISSPRPCENGLVSVQANNMQRRFIPCYGIVSSRVVPNVGSEPAYFSEDDFSHKGTRQIRVILYAKEPSYGTSA
jgi:hypothetical protein